MTTPPGDWLSLHINSNPLNNPSAGDNCIDTSTDQQAARDELETLRNQVETIPDGLIPDAPEWMQGIEDMAAFFDKIAGVWDRVYGDDDSDPLYMAVSQAIATTAQPIQILVLGCGTANDFAPGMLAELRKKFSDHAGQLTLIEGSYLDLDLGTAQYDYAIATLTTHHLPPTTKLQLYKRIHTALKPGGCYVEGDQSTSQKNERQILEWYDNYISKLPGGDRAAWNYDVTLSVETQRRLLTEAGFTSIELTREQRDAEGHGLAFFAASRL